MGRFTHRTSWQIDGHFHDDAQAEAFCKTLLPHVQRAIDAALDAGFLDAAVIPVASIAPHPFRDADETGAWAETVPDGTYGGARPPRDDGE